MIKTKIIAFTVGFIFINWKSITTNRFVKSGNLQTHQAFSALTAEDRNNYILSVDRMTEPKGFGTKEFPSNHLNIALILRLNNNSNDTLKYLMNYVSWSDIFKVDNTLLNIYKVYVGTNPNPSVIQVLPPHKSTTFVIPINYNKTKVSAGLQFKVGIGIFKFINKRQFASFNPAKNLLTTDTANLIWTNTLLIPR